MRGHRAQKVGRQQAEEDRLELDRQHLAERQAEPQVLGHGRHLARAKRREAGPVDRAGLELLEDGHKIETVQRRLGHKDIRTTMGYAEVSDARVRAELEGGPQR